MLSNIKAVADKFGCEFRENAPMSDYTSFKTGGPAELVIMPNSIEALSALISACRESEIKPYIIGNGSNILVSDSGLRGVVLRLAKGLSELKCLGDGVIYADAGVSLSKLCAFALSNNLSGLEFAYGIPGTAGGAAYMNAGAYGGEMKDVLCSVSHINFDGEVGCFEKENLKLGYRCSAYTDSNLIITGLTLKLKNGDYDEIKAAMNLNLNKRKSKQPLEYPSAGSTFKRPVGYFAGGLIEQCGLKGYSIGGAEVSEKHAGFIINKGGATTNDILSLIKYVQNKVFTETGVHLETEVKYIG